MEQNWWGSRMGLAPTQVQFFKEMNGTVQLGKYLKALLLALKESSSYFDTVKTVIIQLIPMPVLHWSGVFRGD